MASGQVSSPNPIKFGDDLELDLGAYELRRAGRPLKLERIPMELLMLLIEQRGQLVTREQIAESIWGRDVFVDADTSINSAIRKIRQVLRDEPENPRFVQTVTGRGYRFIAPLVGPTAPDEAVAAKEESPPPVPPESAPKPTTTRRYWIAGLVAAGLLLALVAVTARRQLLTKPPPAAIRSIAVLPFENLTGNPEQQYFADGMTDALITALAQIRQLRVISRTSAMHYRDTRKTLPEIARELGVDAVVEGSVSRTNRRIRINAQLIQASTDRHLWAESHDRDIEDVLMLQSELARAISSEVQIQLTSQEQANLTAKRPVNPQAYEAYLEGRFFWNKRSKESILKSIEFFDEAIRRDPGYAAAYAGLADAYNVGGCGAPMAIPISEGGPKAKAAALKAVELDGNSAEAHTALGMAMNCYGGKLFAVESEFRKAIALNPNYAPARHFYAVLLLGWRNQEGIEQIQEAVRLDPVSPNSNGLLGEFLFETRQFDKGILQLKKTLELDPNQHNSRVRLGFAYAIVKRYAEAENEFREAERISPGTLSSLGGLAYVYALEGETARVEKMLPELEANAVKTGHPWIVCLVYVGLNRRTEALRWLEKAHDDRDFWFDLENPLVDPLRSDPAFEKLNTRVKAVRSAIPK